MTDETIRGLLMNYTQEAADTKDAVGCAILAQITSEAEPKVIRPKKFAPRRLAAAVILLALALTVFLQTPAGQAFAEYVYENVIQRLFQPEDVNIRIEGIDSLDTLYPYGEVVEENEEGYASYVIYIDEKYDIEQNNNQLIASFAYKPYVMSPEEEAETRARYADDLGMSQEEIDEEIERLKAAYLEAPNLPPVFMEITQTAGTTVEDMTNKLMEEGIYSLSLDYPGYPDCALLTYVEGMEYDSIVVDVYILDNTCGGVFVITVHYFLEATEGHGARLGYAVSTLEIIDLETLN